MSISPPPKHWWRTPLIKDEKIWISIALIWCITITLIMPVWHVVGDQNPSSEYYTLTTDDFDKLTDKFISQYEVGDEAGVSVVSPPPNSDIFLRAAQFAWEPVLKLKVNQTYRLHLSSLDVQHGLSILPINMNFEVVPGWDHILQITPTQTGEFKIVCNEFCGLGHHTMTGKIIVET